MAIPGSRVSAAWPSMVAPGLRTPVPRPSMATLDSLGPVARPSMAALDSLVPVARSSMAGSAKKRDRFDSMPKAVSARVPIKAVLCRLDGAFRDLRPADPAARSHSTPVPADTSLCVPLSATCSQRPTGSGLPRPRHVEGVLQCPTRDHSAQMNLVLRRGVDLSRWLESLGGKSSSGSNVLLARRFT